MSALKQLGLSILGLSVCCGVSAGEHAHKHEHEVEHKHHAHTHEHGVAKVNMAVDNKNVTFEVTLAGNDVVGFEHLPTTKAEQAAYEKVMARLKQSDTVLTLPQAAQCTVTSQPSEKIQFNSSHGEFMATYTYQCQAPEKMKTVTVDLFKLYPAIEKVVFQGVSKQNQNAAELTVKNPTFQWIS